MVGLEWWVVVLGDSNKFINIMLWLVQSLENHQELKEVTTHQKLNPGNRRIGFIQFQVILQTEIDDNQKHC